MEYPITMSHKEYRRLSRANRERDARIAALERAVVEAAVAWHFVIGTGGEMCESAKQDLRAVVDALLAAREGKHDGR